MDEKKATKIVPAARHRSVIEKEKKEDRFVKESLGMFQATHNELSGKVDIENPRLDRVGELGIKFKKLNSFIMNSNFV